MKPIVRAVRNGGAFHSFSNGTKGCMPFWGSITEMNGYTLWRRELFRSLFRTAFEFINAESAQPVRIGSVPLGRDILSKEPDLLFLEFAVNDIGRTSEKRRNHPGDGAWASAYACNPRSTRCFSCRQMNPHETFRKGRIPKEIRAMEASRSIILRRVTSLRSRTVACGGSVLAGTRLRRCASRSFRKPDLLPADRNPLQGESW